MLRNIHAYHYLFYYPLLSLLALLPLAAMAWRFANVRGPGGVRRLVPDLYAIAATGVCALIASLPLFVYAMDWGRWIYIHVLCLFLLLLFVDVREQATVAPERTYAATDWLHYPAWVAAALILYATCWNIPHYGNYPKKGYLNVPFHLLKEEISHRHTHQAARMNERNLPSELTGTPKWTTESLKGTTDL